MSHKISHLFEECHIYPLFLRMSHKISHLLRNITLVIHFLRMSHKISNLFEECYKIVHFVTFVSFEDSYLYVNPYSVRPKVIFLCHQYRDRLYTVGWPTWGSHSSENVRWFIPFKKFGRIRVKQYGCKMSNLSRMQVNYSLKSSAHFLIQYFLSLISE